jgi:hypothetical protein
MEQRLARRNEEFLKICEGCFGLFEIKNAEYQDTISATGVLGAVIELIGVAARLKPLILNNPNFEYDFTTDPDFRKSVGNVLMDLHNYSVIASIMFQNQNWRGR